MYLGPGDSVSKREQKKKKKLKGRLLMLPRFPKSWRSYLAKYPSGFFAFRAFSTHTCGFNFIPIPRLNPVQEKGKLKELRIL